MHIVFAIRAAAIALSLAGGASLFEAPALAQEDGKKAVATFAGGCFWSIEKAFDGKPGVISAVSGFMGGKTKNPTYAEVVSGGTGHLESVQVTYDPTQISYDKLLDIFWHDIDPTDPAGQFCDYGSQYQTAIFAHDPLQKAAAEASKEDVAKELKTTVATEIRDASDFTAAGDEHQDFAKKSPGHYNSYLIGCRRDARLKAVWGEKAHAKI
ncbi:peptide methionine sulfoxide reductase MsrA [Terrihabitans soli]|uniref:Peptide methionine sulfoxide reductase MsrA n=1 Tax=Terrihabitans soli TaxID=708113 RepID=A0A6S6QSS6_9HYPH|nr:peptide-methionine (S)-S-oxide reductase MsrA [Terrihabitans soli]BCJ89508.1 peptide methionine sulfoxide reductase MsrA [Terrihabitans soli]